MRAPLDRESVIKANAQFWEQMLAMSLETIPGEAMMVPETFSLDAGHLLGCVELAGVWKGKVEVRLASGLAYEATAAMMMQPLETVSEADALDAAKEIANMIAGTIKSSLPRPCSMTVPASLVDPENFPGCTSCEDSLEVGFRHASGLLLVRIWEQECL